eukprot:428572_1
MANVALIIVQSLLLFSITFIITPLCSHWIYQLFEHRHEMFMIKRKPKMTIALNLCFLAYILSFDISLFAALIQSDLLLEISTVWLYFVMIWIAYCIMCKSWIIFYDFQLTHQTLITQWTSIIDTSTAVDNWYFKHRQTFGNLRWICKILAVVFLVNFALLFLGRTMMFSSNDTISILGFVIFLFVSCSILISYITILWKTPTLQKVNDVYFIHWGSKLLVKILCILLVLVAVCYVGYMSFSRDWMDNVITLVQVLCIVGVIYSSTRHIIFLNLNSTRNRSIMLGNSERNKGRSHKQNLIRILSNKEAVHLFMQYLVYEYSMEILLSFIEFSQYLEYLENMIDQNQSLSEETSLYKDLDLSKSVPLSSIVANENADHDFKRKAYELYAKYIREGSEYSINIAGKLKVQFKTLMDDYETFKNMDLQPLDIKQIFEECRNEMYQLLTFSHMRFANRDDYKQVIRMINTSTSRLSAVMSSLNSVVNVVPL